MIGLLANLLLASPQVTVVEVSVPETQHIAAVALVPTPLEDRWDVAAQRAMTTLLMEDNETFTRREMLAHASGLIGAPTVESMPGYIRITIACPKRLGPEFAAQLLDSVLRKDTFAVGSIQTALKGSELDDDPWSKALEVFDVSGSGMRPVDVVERWRAWRNPEKIHVAVGGDFIAGVGAAAIQKHFLDWQAYRLIRPRKSGAARPLAKSGSKTDLFEFRGDLVSPANISCGPTAVAMTALGVGKESSLFRIVRETLRWTYRQETVFWPEAGGFRPRLLLAWKAIPEPEGRIEQLRDELLKDVEQWDLRTLERNKRLTLLGLRGQFPQSVWWLDTSGPIDDSVISKTGFAAYLSLVGAHATSETVFATAIEKSGLDEVKEAARRLISAGQVSILRGDAGPSLANTELRKQGRK